MRLHWHRPPQTLTFILQPANLPYLPHAHIGIADDGLQRPLTLRRSRETSDSEALILYIPLGLHTRSNRFGGFPDSVPTQLFVIRTWDLYAAAPCQFYRAVDRKSGFDILSPVRAHRCMAFVNRHSSRRGRIHTIGHIFRVWRTKRILRFNLSSKSLMSRVPTTPLLGHMRQLLCIRKVISFLMQ